MATLTPPSQPVGRLPGEPTPVRYTPRQFHAMAEAGIIPARTELVDGEVLLMPPVHYQHAVTVENLRDALRPAWPRPRIILTQATHRFSGGWEPMPDVALYDEAPDAAFGDVYPLPRLVVEVSETSTAYDLGSKRLRYALEGLAEYWVIDLPARRIVVLSEPVLTAATPETAWRQERVARGGDTIRPLCARGCVVRVDDVLPSLG